MDTFRRSFAFVWFGRLYLEHSVRTHGPFLGTKKYSNYLVLVDRNWIQFDPEIQIDHISFQVFAVYLRIWEAILNSNYAVCSAATVRQKGGYGDNSLSSLVSCVFRYAIERYFTIESQQTTHTHIIILDHKSISSHVMRLFPSIKHTNIRRKKKKTKWQEPI